MNEAVFNRNTCDILGRGTAKGDLETDSRVMTEELTNSNGRNLLLIGPNAEKCVHLHIKYVLQD